MQETAHDDPKLMEAFHLMFDHFPLPAQLVHKSKRIVALNASCQGIGRAVGMICAKHGPAEAHKGCLASKMVKEQKPQWKKMGVTDESDGYMVYWLPVDGYPDYYIHFGTKEPEECSEEVS